MDTNQKNDVEKENKNQEVRRALVSLKKLNDVVSKLPSPADYNGRSITIIVGTVNMKFEKIRFMGSDGKSEFRWSYSSRIVI